MKKPSIIQNSSKYSMPRVNEIIEKINKSSKIDFKLIEPDLSPIDADYFKAMNIQHPLTLQVFAFNVCKHHAQHSRHLLQLETG